MTPLRLAVSLLFPLLLLFGQAEAGEKRLAYLVSDIRIPFWDIMRRGIEEQATSLGYQVVAHSAENSAQRELELSVAAIKSGVDGIILSPTTSSAAATVLKLASAANIPVVIADIGTDAGEYVSYIASDNRGGSYQIGQILVQAMHRKGWTEGSVGIVAIPQKRANGRDRTAGFMQAIEEAGFSGAGIRQQVDFSYQETYDYARELIASNPQMRALWLQGSDRYQGALDAIADSGRQGDLLLTCFDAEPEFIGMIKRGELVGAGMQQPFLIGKRAVATLHEHLSGQAVPPQQRVPVLAVSAENIDDFLPVIRRNVLGLSAE